MFIINDHSERADSRLLEQLALVETATVGHFKHSGFMDPRIRPAMRTRTLVGPAFTVKIPGPDSTLLHRAIDLAHPGDVIVVDRCGDLLHACLGGAVSLAANLRGVAGSIIDGPITDIDEIEQVGLPVYSRGISALTTKLLGYGGEINTAIECGGVIVRPGDYILADRNGILVLSPGEARSVAEEALEMQEEEKEFISRLRAGESLSEMSGASSIIREKTIQIS
jgi:4-hydroxy-4-methyl-2-oxoglutarate aldolase